MPQMQMAPHRIDGRWRQIQGQNLQVAIRMGSTGRGRIFTYHEPPKP